MELDLYAINLEFLFGIAIPAYGAGYVWMIKTARQDPVLYRYIESRVYVGLALVLIYVASLSLWVLLRSWRVENRLAWQYLLILVSAYGVLCHAWISRKFFREIADLPKHQETKEMQHDKNEDDR